MAHVSLWNWLLLRLGLMPAGRSRELLRGQRPVLHPRSAVFLKGVSVAAVIVCIVGLYTASLAGSGLLNSRGLWDTGKVPGGGLPAGHEKRRQFVTSRFSPATRQAIQRIHDRLQLRHGDDVYRNAFKPAAAGAALGDYLGGIGSGQLRTPGGYLRGLGPDDIERLSALAARDLEE